MNKDEMLKEANKYNEPDNVMMLDPNEFAQSVGETFEESIDNSAEIYELYLQLDEYKNDIEHVEGLLKKETDPYRKLDLQSELREDRARIALITEEINKLKSKSKGR